MKRIERGINRLTQRERRILVMLYMQDEEMFDYEIFTQIWASASGTITDSKIKHIIDWPLL